LRVSGFGPHHSWDPVYPDCLRKRYRNLHLLLNKLLLSLFFISNNDYI